MGRQWRVTNWAYWCRSVTRCSLPESARHKHRLHGQRVQRVGGGDPGLRVGLEGAEHQGDEQPAHDACSNRWAAQASEGPMLSFMFGAEIVVGRRRS